MNEKLEVGQCVRAIYEHDSNSDIVGKTGKVISTRDTVDNTQYITIEFDEPIRRGHRGYDGAGKNGHCWNIPAYKVEKYNSYKVDII